eukprot:883972-Rhodomonas_salina.1
MRQARIAAAPLLPVAPFANAEGIAGGNARTQHTAHSTSLFLPLMTQLSAGSTSSWRFKNRAGCKTWSRRCAL